MNNNIQNNPHLYLNKRRRDGNTFMIIPTKEKQQISIGHKNQMTKYVLHINDDGNYSNAFKSVNERLALLGLKLEDSCIFRCLSSELKHVDHGDNFSADQIYQVDVVNNDIEEWEFDDDLAGMLASDNKLLKLCSSGKRNEKEIVTLRNKMRKIDEMRRMQNWSRIEVSGSEDIID